MPAMLLAMKWSMKVSDSMFLTAICASDGMLGLSWMICRANSLMEDIRALNSLSFWV